MKTSVSAKSEMAEEEETQEEDGVLFWVNKNGFPIDETTWERMWNHASKIHPEGNSLSRNIMKKHLPQIAFPSPPLSFQALVSIEEKLEKIQNYMKALQYNHTGTQFFEIKKNRPLSGLMECAKDMIREALPIKCLEAIVLGVFLTNGMMGLERYPISFKTTFNGSTHRHVVLGVQYGGRYGALGMSRREDLMYKPLEFRSLADIVFDFQKAYSNYWHVLKKVKIGFPVSHDPHSFEVINWKALNLTVSRMDKKDIVKDIELHSKIIRARSRSWTMPPNSPKKMATYVDSFKESPYVAKPSTSSRIIRSQTGILTKSAEKPAAVKRKKNRKSSPSEYQIRI
ncbi:tubulinyl-Tyr carboxypeptidase 1-like [Gigantopelta aegis]|uniref:tubulinyl-Tyr carboxypeptidase 1-like n=1 Tax=Gigantopelta aegis TaxID=1735272 RepID=UPI001B8880F6|nr:tubulinyl-Tyr carboxypeptidase 1-like [Gigantopelta aegis]